MRRKSKAESPEAPEVKVQLNELPPGELAAMAEPAAGERLSMLSNAWLLLALRLAGRELPEPMKEPEKATEETAAETVSVVSRSVTVMAPLELMMPWACVSASNPVWRLKWAPPRVCPLGLARKS